MIVGLGWSFYGGGLRQYDLETALQDFGVTTEGHWVSRRTERLTCRKQDQAFETTCTRYFVTYTYEAQEREFTRELQQNDRRIYDLFEGAGEPVIIIYDVREPSRAEIEGVYSDGILRFGMPTAGLAAGWLMMLAGAGVAIQLARSRRTVND